MNIKRQHNLLENSLKRRHKQREISSVLSILQEAATLFIINIKDTNSERKITPNKKKGSNVLFPDKNVTISSLSKPG